MSKESWTVKEPAHVSMTHGDRNIERHFEAGKHEPDEDDLLALAVLEVQELAERDAKAADKPHASPRKED